MMTSPLIIVGGKPLTIAGTLALLFGQAVAQAAPPPANVGAPPSGNMSGWWDASSLTTIGAASWNSYASTMADQSGNAKTATTSGKAVPRQAGLLGGIALPTAPSNYQALHPLLNNYTITASGITTGPAATFYLTWTRAIRPQSQTVLTTTPVTLLSVNGTAVLGMTSNGDGADKLTLFPGSSTPAQAGTIELRHTHSARVVFNGSSVDLWLDGQVIISGASNQITLGATANVDLMKDSQLIFHEAIVWSKVLSGTEHATLTSYASAKWPLGKRQAVNGIIIGQSNASYFTSSFQAGQVINNTVSYLTGCVSSNMLIGGQTTSGTSVFSGQGLYDNTNARLLDNTGGGDPSTWPLGTNGNTYMAMLDAIDPGLKADIRYLWWYWSENDSSFLTYSRKAEYTGAMKRAISLIRARLGMTPGQLPVLVINALPFPTDAGSQTHREVMADLVADPSLNVHFMLAQADDAIGMNDTWDSTTGLESGGGNNAHRDYNGAMTYAHRMAFPIARAALAANSVWGTPDVVTSIDATMPKISGPAITSAHYEGTTYAATGSVLVTVAHDGGNDLLLPLRAALGVGWRLMDGVSDTVAGNPGAPGSLIKATACARVSATQLRVTLASVPTHPTKAQMYYVYGTGLVTGDYAEIGQGNAVTDNFASMALTPGWQIGADMGAVSQPNNPLQATTYGIALS